MGNSLVVINNTSKISELPEEDTDRQELVHVLGFHSVGTSPDHGRLDGLDVETGDNAEVAATALQSPEQIRVGGLACVHNSTIGQNDLIVDDRVASEADLVAVEVDTTSKKQTRHTDGAETTTWNTQVIGDEILIDLTPSARIISSMALCLEVQNPGLTGKRDLATAQTCPRSVPGL